MPSGTTIGTAYVQILPSAEGIKGKLTELLGGEADSAGKSSGALFAQKFGETLSSGLGAAGKLAAKGIGVAVTAAATGVAALTKSAVDAYGNYEQLVGGVETLFGAGGQSLEEYAASMGTTAEEARDSWNTLMNAQNEVLGNAAEAYMTAGLSANEYMETVTSFSASLISSLGGDTKKAAEYADKAITDMSDNANKMGTDMSAIQNAYQGFAKQNYTMLDNLKLGYGGTKSEMERLIEDAEKMDDSFKAARDTNGNLTLSYADIVDAIHIVQTEMGITGTTSKEAMTTIQGSMNATKAAWKNLLTAFGSGEDVQGAIHKLVSTASVAAQNLLPVVKQALLGIADFVKELGPIIVEQLPDLIAELLPGLLDAAVALVGALIQALPGILAAVWETLKGAFGTFMDWLREQHPEITEAISSITETVTEAWKRLKESATQTWETIKTTVAEKSQALGEMLVGKWDNIKQAYEEHGGGIQGIAAAMMQGVKEYLTLGWDTINTLTGGKLDVLKEKIMSVFDRAKEIVKNAVEKLKSLMNFSWSLPKLKMPHISISGSFSISPPSVPHFSIDWYKKAYDTPYLFTKPSVIGALGFGDGIGGEMVYGQDNLMRDIQNASGADAWNDIGEVLERIADFLEDLSVNGVKADAYMDGKKITDYVRQKTRNVQRAYGM